MHTCESNRECSHRATLLVAAFLSLASSIALAQGDTRERQTEALLAASSPRGGVVAVIRDGKPLYRHAFGVADMESGAAVTLDTPFYVASVAKPFTAACVSLLAQRGNIDLDQPVTRYLPQFPRSEKPITVRHLLTHRSGVRDIFDLVTLSDLDPASALASNAAAVTLLAKQQTLNFDPGASACYSNSGYVWLAELVRAVSGRPLDQFARADLFEPLAMPAARFGARPAGGARGHGADGKPIELRSGMVGPGGLWMSLDDFIAWERAFLEAKWSGPQFWKSLVAAPALAAGETLHPRIGEYACGWMLGSYRGTPTVRHPGGSFGYKADYVRFPTLRTAIVVLTNDDAAQASRLAMQVADIWLEAELGPPEPAASAASSAEAKSLASVYIDDATADVWMLDTRAAPRLLGVGVQSALIELGPRRWATTDLPAKLQIHVDGDGDAARLIISGERVASGRCRKLKPIKPTAEALGEFARIYASVELGGVVRFAAQTDRLTLVQRAGALLSTGPLGPFEGDRFISNRGLYVQFKRDPGGKITTAIVQTPGVLRLELRRSD
ncbi:MAG: serine hydrolase domain-containing protein [Phycisphaerae bacterium]